MLQRRDLFRATVAGLVTKVIGPAHATAVADTLIRGRDDLLKQRRLAARQLRELQRRLMPIVHDLLYW